MIWLLMIEGMNKTNILAHLITVWPLARANLNKSENLVTNTTAASKYVLQGFHQVWYQGIVKATVSGVFEDLKKKISEGLDQD